MKLFCVWFWLLILIYKSNAQNSLSNSEKVKIEFQKTIILYSFSQIDSIQKFVKSFDSLASQSEYIKRVKLLLSFCNADSFNSNCGEYLSNPTFMSILFCNAEKYKDRCLTISNQSEEYRSDSTFNYWTKSWAEIILPNTKKHGLQYQMCLLLCERKAELEKDLSQEYIAYHKNFNVWKPYIRTHYGGNLKITYPYKEMWFSLSVLYFNPLLRLNNYFRNTYSLEFGALSRNIELIFGVTPNVNKSPVGYSQNNTPVYVKTKNLFHINILAGEEFLLSRKLILGAKAGVDVAVINTDVPKNRNQNFGASKIGLMSRIYFREVLTKKFSVAYTYDFHFVPFLSQRDFVQPLGSIYFKTGLVLIF